MRRIIVFSPFPELLEDRAELTVETIFVEVSLEVDVFWELERLMKEMVYARQSGLSGIRHWQQFHEIVRPRIILEKQRIWYEQNVMHRGG